MKPNTEPTAITVTAIETSISLRTLAITLAASASGSLSSGTSGGGSNGRVSSSSDCASSSDNRVAGSTGLPAPSVRSKEDLSVAEFMTDRVRHQILYVTAAEKGERLDRVLASRQDALSRSRLKTLILAGAVAIDGITVRDPSRCVNLGESITIAVPPDEPAEPAPEDIPLNIVYEDNALIVIDKPKGLVVHPAAGN